MSQTKAQLIDGKAASVEFSGGSASTPSITFDGDVNTGIFSPAADTIAFAEGGSEAARIDSSGRLLVGTSSARANFFSSSVTAGLQVEGTSANTGTAAIIRNSTNEPGILVLGSSGGTANGSNTLTSNGASAGVISFQATDGTNFTEAARIAVQIDGTPGANDMPGRLVFSTTPDSAASPVERLRIKNNGQVVVGNSTAGDVVYGYKITAATDSDAYTYFGIGDSGAGENGRSRTSTTSSYVHLRLVNGNGGVGSITTSGSSTAYNTTSDYRLKENVAPLDAAIPRLTQIPVHRFNFIADPDTTVDGFLAHEVQAIVPEAITGEKDAVDDEGNPVYQGIDQSKLVPLLTAALQEAVAKIETLEAKVAALEAA